MPPLSAIKEVAGIGGAAIGSVFDIIGAFGQKKQDH